MGGALTASWTYPQQRQVLYAPYQSFSMIIDPRQRGQVRGSETFIAATFQGLAAVAPHREWARSSAYRSERLGPAAGDATRGAT